MAHQYFPDIFNTPSLGHAKQIILTDEGPGADTERRWALETPYVTDLAVTNLNVFKNSVIFDYGCGVGRLSKALIDAIDCFVVGVDISADMRRLAIDYVASDRFLPVSPAQFDALVAAGLRFDGSIAVWVLQHCFDPMEDIARINRGLKEGARLFVLNMHTRAVPAVTDGGGGAPNFLWVTDTVDVASALAATLHVVAEGAPDPERTPNMADAGAFWMTLRREP